MGATLLGTGGGGDPYVGKLLVKQAIEDYGPARVVDVDELPDEGLIMTTAIIGAPTVIWRRSRLAPSSDPASGLSPPTWAQIRWL